MANYSGNEVVHRKIPMFMTIMIILALALILFLTGLMMGYGVLHSPFGIFNPNTWTHIFELTGSLN
ncbi:DNA-directed RNA polymerase subunit beta [Macrococcus bovicus]|nr:DNA-directed RNA polymerase subunit beta [Macrococcus bovicus]WJP97576.1 DNA-directed RNA polymerase subunit beta [Macrococcus bovicus]